MIRTQDQNEARIKSASTNWRTIPARRNSPRGVTAAWIGDREPTTWASTVPAGAAKGAASAGAPEGAAVGGLPVAGAARWNWANAVTPPPSHARQRINASTAAPAKRNPVIIIPLGLVWMSAWSTTSRLS